jgi:hypothetical protein
MFGRRTAATPDPKPAAPSAPKPESPVVAAPAPASAPTVSSGGHGGGESHKSGEALLASPTEENLNKTIPKAALADDLSGTKEKIYALLMEQIDIATSSRLPRDELKRQIIELIGEIVIEQKLLLSSSEQQMLAGQIVDDMLGFGPLEPLLRDEAVTDIMVNGPYQIYVERKGKLELTDIKFRDNSHVMAIATRIVTGVGRRVDESNADLRRAFAGWFAGKRYCAALRDSGCGDFDS